MRAAADVFPNAIGDEPGHPVTWGRVGRSSGHRRVVVVVGRSAPNRAVRHGGQAHHSFRAVGWSVGLPGNIWRHLPHWRGSRPAGSCAAWSGSRTAGRGEPGCGSCASWLCMRDLGVAVSATRVRSIAPSADAWPARHVRALRRVTRHGTGGACVCPRRTLQLLALPAGCARRSAPGRRLDRRPHGATPAAFGLSAGRRGRGSGPPPTARCRRDERCGAGCSGATPRTPRPCRRRGGG